MPHFTELNEWRYNPDSGVLEFRFKGQDGKTYEASFSREIVPALIVHLTRLLTTTVDEFPEGLCELVSVLAPKSITTVVLPNSSPALEITTVEDLKLPFILSKEVIDAIRATLIDADTLVKNETSH